MTFFTRFAPSPTGHLHLGHAFSALFAAEAARKAGGQFIVRIEDIDAGRCRTDYTDSILDDLSWLGLRWQSPVRHQSRHMDDYAQALDSLKERDLLYPCFCTRADIRNEIDAAGHAPHGPDGPLYPGTCRTLSRDERNERIVQGIAFALRLDVKKACAQSGLLTWHDIDKGPIPATPEIFGDVVLARKDVPASYHLAVTHDDHAQKISLVTRGLDLFEATHIHRLLQALLGLDTPDYCHHRLLVDAAGRRFAKRDKAPTLNALRQSAVTPDEVFEMIGWERTQ
jgi:glutamyl-Q tRNA(Asp) synthetase